MVDNISAVIHGRPRAAEIDKSRGVVAVKTGVYFSAM